MADTPKQDQRPGLVRRIAGVILIGLGVTFWLCVLWMFMANAPRFTYESWLRFWFLLWTATVFVSVGYWLKFRSRAALWSAVTLFIGEIAFIAWFVHWVQSQPIPPHLVR